MKPDDKSAIPLCWQCHHEQHQIGEKEFFARCGLDIVEIRATLEAKWKQQS